MIKKLLLFSFAFLVLIFVYLIKQTGFEVSADTIEPHPACGVGQACYTERRVNQWGCSRCAQGNVCINDIYRQSCSITAYGDTCPVGKGPCQWDCQYGSNTTCYQINTFVNCIVNQSNCRTPVLSYVSSCVDAGTDCNLGQTVETLGCCGPGSGATNPPGPTPTPSGSCTVDLTPATLNIQPLSAGTLTASVTIGSGTVDRVDFVSLDVSRATVSPASDSTVVYSTQATGVAVGSTTVRADVVMGGAVRCTDSSTVNVVTAGPWWQVQDADITTNGDLGSQIPGTCTLPACNPVLGLEGTGGFPGVPSYGGATADFEDGVGTGSAAEVPYNWLANSRYNGRTFDYSYFERQIPDDVILNEVTPPVTGGTFNSGGSPSRGYVWYHWNGATLGDLTINGNVNLVGSRKAVLLVEGADLLINGRINFQSPGSGFFMAVVGKDANGLKGNIFVDPSVSHPTQVEIEGVFLAEGEFRSGAGTDQLHVRGSVVAYDGVVLQRDLGGNNGDTPAELFEYAPDIIATFPRVFTQRRIRWKEVAP